MWLQQSSSPEDASAEGNKFANEAPELREYDRATSAIGVNNFRSRKEAVALPTGTQE